MDQRAVQLLRRALKATKTLPSRRQVLLAADDFHGHGGRAGNGERNRTPLKTSTRRAAFLFLGCWLFAVGPSLRKANSQKPTPRPRSTCSLRLQRTPGVLPPESTFSTTRVLRPGALLPSGPVASLRSPPYGRVAFGQGAHSVRGAPREYLVASLPAQHRRAVSSSSRRASFL